MAIIQVTNLITKYGSKTILNDISFTIKEGEIFVILGTSGCGKSTLLKHLVTLYSPFAGNISIFGESILNLDSNARVNLLKKIGMLFQHGALLNSLTIHENVAIPLQMHTKLTPEFIRRMVEKKLELVSLSHASALMPAELSGGMLKRAGLARAISLDPPLLFCDEPSAGLDPMTSAQIDKLLLQLKEQLKMTIVVVTHELASIERIADRILFMDKGKILFCGTLKDGKKFKNPIMQEYFSAHNAE